jgi:serine/threonine-protein kinase HipA
LGLFSCLRDAAPDAWGRRVIANRVFGRGEVEVGRDIDERTYLLQSGSDRTGALDFQESASGYVSRDMDAATLVDLHEAAELLATDHPIPTDLEEALYHGTANGGARPKAAITGDTSKYIAKFSISTDTFQIMKAEYVAMTLASRIGLDVATVSLENVAGKDILLVERFDREKGAGGWYRRSLVSALTVMGLDERWAREASYPDLVDQIRVNGVEFRKDATELFSRMVFNVLMGNTDDHARNHSFFVEDGRIRLTPAYDITPFPRVGGEAGHGMKVTRASNLPRINLCLETAADYGLSEEKARAIVERQISGIMGHFDDLCKEAGMTTAMIERLRGRAVLNPDVFAGCEEFNPKGW